MSPDKLRALADRIDHEQLWRRAGIERGGMTTDQIDRLDAAVELRRWADRKRPGRWIIVPPEGPVQFSAQSLQKAFEMAQTNENRRKMREGMS